MTMLGIMNVKDHPRSRGVYAYEMANYGEVTGSSPLARGLLSISDPQVKTDGIIPARAGFTG